MFGLGKKSITEEQQSTLDERLKGMVDPLFEKNLFELDWVKGIRFEKKTAVLSLELPTLALKHRDALEADLVALTKEILDVEEAEIEASSDVKSALSEAFEKMELPGIRNVILVASGKGGVGKSTVAANFAAGLKSLGCSVGLLDADVYGPSVPTMFGIDDGSRPGSVPSEDPKRPIIIPLEKNGIKLMSMGFLVDTSTPMVWRGPMIASACMQLFRDVQWGELDYLVVDMPPGTGDIQLTISQQVGVAGAVIVSTPQEVALVDVVRAKAMFDKVSIESIGVVENMSYFVCDGCDKRHEIFAHGGARKAAEEQNVPFLAEIPLEPSVMKAADGGEPIVFSSPQSASAKAFIELAQTVATSVAKKAASQSKGPKLTISGVAKPSLKKGGLPIL
ncbi:MAG: Mrp/NBP35 family ATP-binding protein [Deltaproteobacteria bacterium]|nr:Mrp/NBP35 family ATP-binding protein [Deltaproteobacteria bacterium]